MTSLKINLWVVRTDKKCGHGSLASAPCQDHVNWCGSGRTLAYRRLLRPRRERPPYRRAAEQRDEITTFHSITSSARPDRGNGTVMPSALAVLRLMISSTFVDCTTGRSAGFSPLRMRPV